MKDLLFVDTSAWFALVNRSDSGHTAVREFLESYRGRRVTSNAVFDETVTLCRYRLGHDTAGVVDEMPNATLHELDGADHGFAVLKSSGRTREDVWQEVTDVMLRWVEAI